MGFFDKIIETVDIKMHRIVWELSGRVSKEIFEKVRQFLEDLLCFSILGVLFATPLMASADLKLMTIGVGVALSSLFLLWLGGELESIFRWMQMIRRLQCSARNE